MLLLDVVFIGSIVIILFILFKKLKKQNKILTQIENQYEGTLLSFVNDNNLAEVDIDFLNPGDLKKKSRGNEVIRFVGVDINKGYDFIEAKHEKGYIFGPHVHHNSSEFFYVVSGKIKITECSRAIKQCEKCKGDCGLYGGNDNGFIDTFILNSGDHYFLTAETYHTFEALEDSFVIVVTMPPIGKLYLDQYNIYNKDAVHKG